MNNLAASRFLSQVLGVSRFTCMLPGASLKGVMRSMAVGFAEKNLSFVWAELSKYCLLNAFHTVISGTRVRSVCTLVDGELPDTCVAGSGVYRCNSVINGRDHVFELRLSYLEVDRFGDTVYVTAIIDLNSSRPQLPLGLLLA